MRVLAQAPIDVVLTDFRLPGADGLALVKQIQSSSPEVPVVVLTGQGTIASAVECLKSGASDYLLEARRPRSPRGRAGARAGRRAPCGARCNTCARPGARRSRWARARPGVARWR